MTDTEIKRIVVRRGTAAEAATANPVLAAGEFGYETDTGVLRIGDGVTRWTALGALATGASVSALSATVDGKVDKTSLGAANGVATLDANTDLAQSVDASKVLNPPWVASASAGAAGGLATLDASGLLVQDVPAANVVGTTAPELELQLSADQQIPNATSTDITQWTAVRNVGGMWTSGKTVTISQPGVYALGVTSQWNGTASGGVAVGILVNGTPVRWQGGQDFINNEFNQKSAEIVKRLAAGDVVTFQVEQNSGGAINLETAGGAGTMASVYWLRS